MPGEGIVFRYCHDIAVVADAGIDCVLAEQRKMHERQIQLVVVDEHFQREGSPLCDGKLDVRIAVLERKKHLGQNDGADMGRSPETKDAFALGLYLTQLLVEAAAKRDGLTGKFNVFLACVGRDKSTFGALEKPGLKLRFQPCEENAEGRLGDIELFGGFREAFFLIDGQNIFKISVFHETAPFCQRGCFVAFIIAQNGKNEKRNWPMQSTGQFPGRGRSENAVQTTMVPMRQPKTIMMRPMIQWGRKLVFMTSFRDIPDTARPR